jgi:hypothetical protein
VPKNLFSPSLKVWDISELELARQLTIMEFHCFTKIQVALPPSALVMAMMVKLVVTVADDG